MMGMKGYEVRSSSLGWQPVFVDECPNLAVMSIGFLLPGDDDPIIWRGPRKSGIIR